MTIPSPSPTGATRWTAIVLAGQRPGGDPLAAHFAVATKALIRVKGEPMIGRVLRTLTAVERIGAIVVVARDVAPLRSAPAIAWASDDPRVRFAASAGSIAAGLKDLLGDTGIGWPVLVTTADHPLLTPEMVTTFLDAAEEGDAAVGLVERRTLLARYPANRRTWLRLWKGAYSGANLFAFYSPAVVPLLDDWARVEQDRKKGWRIAAGFGPALLLRVVTRTISIRGALARIGGRYGITIVPVLLPQPEAAIDVDKPDDHAAAEAILAARDAR